MFEQGDLVMGVSAPGSEFDLNSDLVIDQIDIDEWLDEAAALNGYDSPYRRGDADRLGAVFPDPRDVDITDFNTLASNFDPTGAKAVSNTWDKANFDGDDDIDITDFNFLAGNFSPTGYGSVAIPEPSAVAQAVLGIVGLVGFFWLGQKELRLSRV